MKCYVIRTPEGYVSRRTVDGPFVTNAPLALSYTYDNRTAATLAAELFDDATVIDYAEAAR